MKKEVAIKEENKVVLSAQQLADEWGVPTTPSTDMVIPKILPMQGLSKLVVDRKAMIGEFRDSLSGKLIGSIDKPFAMIPFLCVKLWDVQHQQPDGTYKYNRSVPLIENPLDKEYNDNWTWEGEETDLDGKLVKIKRIRRLNFFVLLPDEVKDGSAMPYVLSFKSTGLKEGKKLWTSMYVRNAKASIPPAAFTFQVGGKMVTNDKGSFVVMGIDQGRRTTDAELKECLSWLKLVRQSNVKVDNSDVEAVETEVGGDTGEF